LNSPAQLARHAYVCIETAARYLRGEPIRPRSRERIIAGVRRLVELGVVAPEQAARV
jgi:hypothetical protein